VTPYCFFTLRTPLLFVPLHIWRDHKAENLWSCAVAGHRVRDHRFPGAPLQVVVTQMDKITDGSMTYHFAVKVDQGEALTPGESKAPVIS
jgi:hypothetical protein